MTSVPAIILGTSLRSIGADSVFGAPIDTPFGSTSSDVIQTEILGSNVLLLARHGKNGRTYAHAVNYKANMWALKEKGARQVIATATVGGIHSNFDVGDVVIPDQVIDYTYGREHTFYGDLPIAHFDFTYPFSERMRRVLIQTRQDSIINDVRNRGTYGCTQGPRLETAAEIQRLKQDGCDLVGMTLMPEAALAGELDIEYAAVCLVVNVAAGLTTAAIDVKQTKSIAIASIEPLRAHLGRAIQSID